MTKLVLVLPLDAGGGDVCRQVRASGRRKTLGRAVVWGIALGMMLCSGARSQDGRVITEGPDFPDFVANQELSFIGSVAAVDTIVRNGLGGCGHPGTRALPVKDVHFRVERVLAGCADDSLLVVTCSRWAWYPDGGLAPGVRAIVWAFHDCTDGWRLWGNCALITTTGHVLPRAGTGIQMGGEMKSAPMTYAAVDSGITAALATNSNAQFRGAGAVALVRVTGMSFTGPGDWFTCAVDSQGWVMGEGAAVPRVLTPRLSRTCLTELAVGDSLLVPLPAGWSGDRLAISGCIDRLRVKSGFAPGLGVPLGLLSRALEPTASGLAVRPFVSRD